MAKAKYVPIPEFARGINRTPEYVRRLIAKGKITKIAVKRKGKRWLVNPEIAVSDIEKNISYINRGKQNINKTSQKKKLAKKAAAKKPNGKIKTSLSTEEKKAELENAGIILDEGSPLSEAQRVDAYYKAMLRKQKYEKDSGDLIEVSKVEKAAYEAGRQIKEQCLAIADRCSPMVAAESDQFECRQILIKEINYILEGLSNALQIQPGPE